VADDAKIKVGVEGADEVERAANRVSKAWGDAAGKLKSAFADAAKATISDLGGVVTSAGKVNFSSLHEQVKAFEASTARLAVASKGNLEGVRAEFEHIGKSIGKRPQEVAAWSASVGRLTYDFRGATDSIKGFSAIAAATGRSVEDFQGLAVTLGSVGKVSGDASDALNTIWAQAEKVGTVGGPAALLDQIDGLGDGLGQFAIKGEKDLLKITGLVATLGKGLDPGAARRVAGGALGALTSDPERWRRFLGRDVLDDKGHIADPTQALKDITEKVKKRYGKNAARVMRRTFGSETGMAMMNANFDEAAKLAGVAPSAAPAGAQQALLATDAGKRDVAEAQLAESARNLLGSSTALGSAADALQRFSAANPVTGNAVATAGSALPGTLTSVGGSIVGAGGAALAATKGGGALVGAGKALAGIAGKALPVLGAAAAGYGVGTLADRAFGISDWISGTGESSRVGQDSATEAGQDAALAQKVAMLREKRAARLANPAVAAPADDKARAALAVAAQSGTGANVSAAVKQFAAELKNQPITIINATGGPVEAVKGGKVAAQSNAQ